MLTWLRQLLFSRELAKRSRLIELARQADELLLGSALNPETRAVLQRQREAMETEIRALRVT